MVVLNPPPRLTISLPDGTLLEGDGDRWQRSEDPHTYCWRHASRLLVHWTTFFEERYWSIVADRRPRAELERRTPEMVHPRDCFR